jgi:ferredoxin
MPAWTDCNGCNLCLLACPVQRRGHDLTLTPMLRARALQSGATALELAAAIDACLVCGACEPACPEKIPLVPLIQDLRAELRAQRAEAGISEPAWKAPAVPAPKTAADAPFQSTILVPGPALARETALLARVVRALGGPARCAVATDAGHDLADARDAGRPVDPARARRFLAQFAWATTVIADGALLGLLRQHLAHAHLRGLGEMLLPLRAPRRKALRAGDLLIVESRFFHGDHARLVAFYDRLRQESGCAINLDLQRIAIATGAASLQGRRDPAAAGCRDLAREILAVHPATTRIVLEDPAELPVFAAAAAGRRIVHLADVEDA